MKAVCKTCTGGRKDPLVIVSKLTDDRYFVHCPNCDSLYISKKSFFSSTLKNEYMMKLLELIEYINTILDHSHTSIMDVLNNNVKLKESVGVYLISEGHLVVSDELGCKNKHGEFIPGVFLANIYDDDKRREVFREMRISAIQEAIRNPKDVSDFIVPWSECGKYC